MTTVSKGRQNRRPPLSPGMFAKLIKSTYSVDYMCKNRRNFGYQGQLKSRKNGFDPREIQISGRFQFKCSRLAPLYEPRGAEFGDHLQFEFQICWPE